MAKEYKHSMSPADNDGSYYEICDDCGVVSMLNNAHLHVPCEPMTEEQKGDAFYESLR